VCPRDKGSAGSHRAGGQLKEIAYPPFVPFIGKVFDRDEEDRRGALQFFPGILMQRLDGTDVAADAS
jgi:hypothetical protein